MKLNYLLPEKEANEPCDGSITKLKKHTWEPEVKLGSQSTAQLGPNSFARDVKGDIGIFLHQISMKLIKIFWRK